jgi:hypothetical protein
MADLKTKEIDELRIHISSGLLKRLRELAESLGMNEKETVRFSIDYLRAEKFLNKIQQKQLL